MQLFLPLQWLENLKIFVSLFLLLDIFAVIFGFF